MNVRMLFRKGQLGNAGSVSWDFKHLGLIEAVPSSPGADPEVAAIEAGAQDFEPAEDGATLFMTDLTDLDSVSRALPAQGFTVQSAQLGYRAKNPVTMSSTSPANMLPNSRNENDIILANSETNSSMPTKNSIGPFSEKNFDRCALTPSVAIPDICIRKTMTVARASVTFKSDAADRKTGTKSSASWADS